MILNTAPGKLMTDFICCTLRDKHTKSDMHVMWTESHIPN